MLTPTDSPLRATALALKRGGRSLGIGVVAEPDLCVAMPIFAKWFADDSSHPVVFLSLLGTVGWLMAIPALHRGASHGPIAWLLCGLTGDWCNLTFLFTHSVSTFYVWFALFLFLFAVVHFQFIVTVACCVGALTFLHFVHFCSRALEVSNLFFKKKQKTKLTSHKHRTCVCVQL